MTALALPTLPVDVPLKDALRILREAEIDVAHVGIVDLFGTLRERRIAVSDLPAVLGSNATFANVLPHWSAAEEVLSDGPFGGEEISIDFSSLRRYPFEARACLVFADYTGPLAALSPRRVLQTQLENLRRRGWNAQAAFESEFIVLEETASSLRESDFANVTPYAVDNRCWSGDSAATHADLVSELAALLADGEVSPLAIGLELGPGCLEATLRHGDPLRAADDQIAFKLFTKAFCRRRGLTASFMAQLGADFPGLSQHVHVSVTDQDTSKNLFPADAGMSELFRQFVAGLLALMPDSMPFTHANPNSYRRIAPGNWAPKSPTWAEQNYAAAVRVVMQPAASCRLEYRLPGADANPYLNLAFVLGAGLWGVDRELTLTPAFQGGSPDSLAHSDVRLPHDLYSALERLKGSDAAASIWGETFINYLCKMLAHEEAVLRRHTSAAERARYLEIV
ncbi:MAG: glutamine synthetase [Gammaproteobacteria bacterium]|jgi:glutamine synthetase